MTPKRTYCCNVVVACKCRGKTYTVSAEPLLALSGLHREHWCDNSQLPVKQQTKQRCIPNKWKQGQRVRSLIK